MRIKPFALGAFSGAVLVCGVLGVNSALRYDRYIHPALPPPLTANDFDLPQLHPPYGAVVIEGTAIHRGRILALAHDGRAEGGVFECDGASKWKSDYDADETVYVIDGKAHVTHAAGSFTLEAGDSAFFPAGASATWTVPERLKKTFFSAKVGRAARVMRSLGPWHVSVAKAD